MSEFPCNRELPSLVGEESSQLFFNECRRLLATTITQSDVSHDSQSDVERHAIYKTDNHLVYIHQYPNEDSGSQYEVSTRLQLSDNLIETKSYALDTLLDLSMYDHVIDRCNNESENIQIASSGELDLQDGSYDYQLDPILNGLYDFTEDKLAELLNILDTCNKSNRISPA